MTTLEACNDPVDKIPVPQSEPANKPTLSVLLPTYCDGWRLGVQLQAILSQLSEDDELILLLDGSDELTREVANSIEHPSLRIHSNERPSGVCSAFNQCHLHASKDWILGASGNDELQPGTIDAWRFAVQQWPDAHLVHGDITPTYEKRWTHQTSFISKCDLPAIWRNVGWFTHGAAAFFRREDWGNGYIVEHGYHADAFQTMVIGWRYGLIDLHHYCSRVLMDRSQYSARGYSNHKEHNHVIREMKKTLNECGYDDVRDMAEEFMASTRQFDERITPDTAMSLESATRLAKLMVEPRMGETWTAAGGVPGRPVDFLTGLLDMILWLREQDADIENVMEIGAYTGASGELFALHYPNVISVDLWQGFAEFARPRFEARRKNYPHWAALAMSSVLASEAFPPGCLDLVYIDGDHNYGAVKKDIAAWLPKIRPGGYIAGHDFGFDQQGVTAAVMECLGEPDAVFCDTSWIRCLSKPCP